MISNPNIPNDSHEHQCEILSWVANRYRFMEDLGRQLNDGIIVFVNDRRIIFNMPPGFVPSLHNCYRSTLHADDDILAQSPFAISHSPIPRMRSIAVPETEGSPYSQRTSVLQCLPEITQRAEIMAISS